MYEHDDNPYAPPVEYKDDSKGTSYEEGELPFEFKFGPPQRFTNEIKVLFRLVLVFSSFLALILHLGLIICAIVIANSHDPFTLKMAILVMIILLSCTFLWWMFGYNLSFLPGTRRWIVEPIRSGLPDGIEPELVLLYYHKRFDLKKAVQEKKISDLLFDVQEDIGLIFIENDTLRFEGDRSSFTLHREAVKLNPSNLEASEIYMYLCGFCVKFKKHPLNPYSKVLFSVYEDGFIKTLDHNRSIQLKMISWLRAEEI